MRKRKRKILDKKVKTFVITAILGWLVYILGSIVDGIFAGSQSEAALAGVEVVAPFYAFIGFIPALFCEGAAIKFSYFIGKNDLTKARKIFGLGLFATLFLGVLTAAIMAIFKTQFISIFVNYKTNPDVYQCTSEYYDWFIPIAVVFPIYQYVYRVICEDAEVVWTLTSDIVQMITNFVLSAILINKIGVKGLGLSTFISLFASMLVLFLHFFRKKNNVKFGFEFSLKEVRKMISLGSGCWLNALFVVIVDLVLNAFISNKFNVSYLATYAVINFVISFSSLFTSSSSSISGFLTIADAQRNKDEIKKLITLGFKWELIICITSSIIMCAFCWAVPMLYSITPEAGDIYKTSWVACLSISATFILYGFLDLYGVYYVSLQKPLVSIINQITLQLVFPLGLSIMFSYILNSFYGIIIGLTSAGICSFLFLFLFLKIRNKSHKILEIPDYNEIQFSYDLELVDQEIVKTRDLIGEKLLSLSQSKSIVNKTMVVVEDLLFLIKKENANSDKVILDRITICVGEKTIRILNKDSGKMFDVYRTGKNEKINNNSFALFTSIPMHKSIRNNIMMSFNVTSLIVNM